ncbi:alpha/beta hydrolase [Anabaenopsis elenkinii CCIBt3563]|uniref:Alpha/beta hydrolase n=2 Tax=Anabaenopsis TaxID=110103 RepID=A0A7S6U5M0_9CYAN|nr:alpha/beta hydrolase [Anabaenopsis elenkinii CCIBt3563]
MRYTLPKITINIFLLITIMSTYLLLRIKPVKAAENVILRYGILEESISVEDLQKIAKTGIVPRQYQVYTQKFPPQEQQKFLEILRKKIPVNFVSLSRLLYTPVGSTILQDFSKLTFRKDEAGMQALRTALVHGSKTSEGLSVISFIQNYPSQNLVINVAEVPRVFGSFNLSYQQSNEFIQAITPQLAAKPTELNLPFDPGEVGTGKVQVINLPRLKDEQRQRLVPVDIYWSNAAISAKPVVILSHGYSSDRTDMRYIAEHLASHGYVVAALEHIGSNQDYRIHPIQGGLALLMKPQEFLERPKDISFILDQLAEFNQQEGHPLQGKLTTNKAMVIGHSFGGGTAMSIAGGELQVDFLRERCAQFLDTTVNFGEGLQCVAKTLPQDRYRLGDPRIKQAIALNPTTSLMFGETGLENIQIPTLILASSADQVTPALTEQIISFSKISAPKWLIGIMGATHGSIKDPISTANREEQGGVEVVGEQAADLHRYIKVITLAFAAQMTPQGEEYKIFLTPEYAQYASTQGFPIRLVTEIPADVLEKLQLPR